MKRLLFLLVLFLFSCTSQEKIVSIKESYTVETQKDRKIRYYFKDTQKYFEPFVGTWIYKDGSQTFVVQFTKQEKVLYQSSGNSKYFMDELIGHYKLVQNYGATNEQIIYTSQINAGNSITPWVTIIFGAPLQQYLLDGTIYDVNTPYTDDNPLGLKGMLKMSISPSNTNSAQWNITLPSGLHNSANTGIFTIPTNVTLTKVN